MNIREFNQFFMEHKSLPDNVLAEKLIAKFNLSYNKAVIINLIKFTRQTKI